MHRFYNDGSQLPLLTFGFRLTWILSFSRDVLQRQALSSLSVGVRRCACKRTEINLDDSAQQKNLEAGGRMKERFPLCFGQPAFLAFVLGLSAFVGLAGCSANASKTTQTPLISLTLTQVPPTSLNVVGTAQVSATVSGDPASAGVDWFAQCASAPNCGSFSPSHTASGATTTFTAPPAVPAKNTVAVTAVSATDHSKSSAATVTILSTVSGVTITQPPPASLPSQAPVTLILAGSAVPSGAQTVVAAAVAGDPSNSGVDWKVTCGTVNCTPPGLFSNLNGSASFIVPGPGSSPPVDLGTTITLTAFAHADHNFSASTSFTVSAPASVSMTQPPPSSLLTNATSTVIATVSNDSSNAGVDWIVSCANTPCGSFSPGNSFQAHTASGAPLTFTAPPTVPDTASDHSGVVTITATATANPAAFATASVKIVAPVTVAITQTIPTNSIVINQSAPLVATVSNDPSNAGVDWSASCGASAGNCGSFSPTHTASGAATSYTAPTAAPPGGTVTITAASTTSSSQTATYTLTVTAGVPPDSLLSGQFVMLLSAKNSSSGPFALGGYLTGDGAGNITTGTLDAVNRNGGLVSVLPSTYSIGPDGRGQIQLSTSSSLGVNGSGAVTLSVVFVTPQHALLTETDSSGAATGTLDLQNASGFAGFTGTYSLQLSGLAATGPNYFVASALTVPSANSYSYVTDESNNGVITSVPFTTVSHGLPVSSYTSGSYTFTSLNLGLGTPFSALNVWVIDATHFVVTDWRNTPNVFGYLTVQPSSPALSGAYAFTEAGATAAGTPQAAGGVVTCGSSGTLDVVSLGGTPLTNQSVNATCTAPANGRGLISISAASGASTGGISQFAAYPTADQGLYLVELDGGSAGTSGPSGAGVALSQTLRAPISASALTGAYASQFAASTALGSQVFAGQILADGVTTTLNGSADVNSFNATAAPPVATPSSGAALSGSFTSVSDGRFPMMLAISPASGQQPPQITPLDLACYIVNANTCLLLGLDATAPGTGILQLQNTGL
jgi:hypothetical protein